MKDHFSGHASEYASFRPRYPKALFRYVQSLVPQKQCCWDCGTGNGQVAAELSKAFAAVEATDISDQQLKQAPELKNVTYSIQPAEKTNFPDDLFDLIVVAQAVHWFDFDRFYQEVIRTGKAGCVIVIVGYGLLHINEKLDPLLDHFYHQVTGPYWDPERQYLDEAYRTIPFPFEEIEPPAFVIECKWTLEHFIGYLNTWSAVKKYERSNGENPVKAFATLLKPHWNDSEVKDLSFPLFLRIGTVKK